MKVIKDNDLNKKGIIRKDTNVLDKIPKKVSPEDKQLKVLNEIKSLLSKGIKDSEDPKALVDSIVKELALVLSTNSRQLKEGLKILNNSIKSIKLPPAVKPIKDLKVRDIQRDGRGMMTGFDIKTVR